MFLVYLQPVEPVSHKVRENRPEPLFSLGQTVATLGALDVLAEASELPFDYLARHQVGDWGTMPEEDVAENELSLRHGYRLMSAYNLPTGVRIWVITEADRSVTTILLPMEY